MLLPSPRGAVVSAMQKVTLIITAIMSNLSQMVWLLDLILIKFALAVAKLECVAVVLVHILLTSGVKSVYRMVIGIGTTNMTTIALPTHNEAVSLPKSSRYACFRRLRQVLVT